MQDQRITGFELSSVQEQLYTISKGASQFQCQSAVLIDGVLDLVKLSNSVDFVLAAYEVLRANFRMFPGRRSPLQLVQPSPITSLEVADVPASGSTAKKAHIEMLLRGLREEPFDLEKGALAAFKLLHLGDASNILVFTVSSLCADTESVVLILDEIFSRYQGTTSSEMEPFLYADFSVWQRYLQQSEEPEAQQGRDYWKAQEESALPWQVLPYENGDPGLSLMPDSVSVPFSPLLISELAKKYNAGKTEAEDFLLASWIALFQRLTHQDAGLVGLCVDGRRYEELGAAVGLFAKIIPIAWSIDSTKPMEWLVSQVASARKLSEPWQDYYISQATSIEDPFLLSLSFNWQPRFKGRAVDKAAVSLYSQYVCTDAWALNLSCFVEGGAITAEIQFDANRFQQRDMVRLADQLAMLAEAAAFGSTPIGELPLLPHTERQTLLIEWNKTEAAYPSDSAIHHLFEAQADRTPEATALVYGDERYTYCELNEKSSQIARLLKSKGVGRNNPVVLCAERSACTIVGLLAVLKSGGYYVPVAADLPAAHMEALLETCNPSVVLTQSRLMDKFVRWTGNVIGLDSDMGSWAELPASNPEHSNLSGDLACVIFTFESTGAPRGFGNGHQGLVNYSVFIANMVGIAQSEGGQWHFGTVSELHADLGNSSIFPSLAHGGCLHVIGLNIAADADAFAEYVEKNPLDLLMTTPLHLRALLSATRSNVLPAKYLFLGGEALTWDLVSLSRHRGNCTVINYYCPRETTVGSLTYDATSGTISAGDCPTVPIGRPIANTQVYVLDELANPVPIGVSGELYIGGAAAVAGYIHHSEGKSDRFIRNPFVSDPTSLIYRTGDRVRCLGDGSIEFLGTLRA